MTYAVRVEILVVVFPMGKYYLLYSLIFHIRQKVEVTKVNRNVWKGLKHYTCGQCPIPLALRMGAIHESLF